MPISRRHNLRSRQLPTSPSKSVHNFQATSKLAKALRRVSPKSSRPAAHKMGGFALEVVAIPVPRPAAEDPELENIRNIEANKVALSVAFDTMCARTRNAPNDITRRYLRRFLDDLYDERFFHDSTRSPAVVAQATAKKVATEELHPFFKITYDGYDRVLHTNYHCKAMLQRSSEIENFLLNHAAGLPLLPTRFDIGNGLWVSCDETGAYSLNNLVQ